MYHSRTPQGCIHHNPSTKSILFSGAYINLNDLHLKSGLSLSYLSLIFNHKRTPSIHSAERIAQALQISVGSFIQSLRGDVPKKKWQGKHSAQRSTDGRLAKNRLQAKWRAREAIRVKERADIKKQKERDRNTFAYG